MKKKEFALEVEGLTVSFDGFKAVDDLSFYVDEGEIRVIIGPNGAGKTTVLDLICGKTKATSGSIRFRGTELTKLKENEIVDAGVGRKFQNPSIYENLTVFENLELSYPKGKKVFGALFFRRDQEVIDKVREEGIPAVMFIEFSNEKMADVICEDTGCEKLLFHSCHNVSAGQLKNGVSYLELMWANVESLKEALG